MTSGRVAGTRGKTAHTRAAADFLEKAAKYYQHSVAGRSRLLGAGDPRFKRPAWFWWGASRGVHCAATCAGRPAPTERSHYRPFQRLRDRALNAGDVVWVAAKPNSKINGLWNRFPGEKRHPRHGIAPDQLRARHVWRHGFDLTNSRATQSCRQRGTHTSLFFIRLHG